MVGHYRRRPLKPETLAALDRLLPQLLVTPQQVGDTAKLFSFIPKKIHLEVGFGVGDYLLEQVRAHPDIGFIGCEPYINGMAKFLLALEGVAPPNLRLYQGNGKDLLDNLNHLDRLVLLYPDPWPKRRHAKHRFIQKNVLDQLGLIMPPAAEVFCASDDSQLLAWTLAHFSAHHDFVWQAARTQQPPLQAAPISYYERKALEQNKYPARLVFTRK